MLAGRGGSGGGAGGGGGAGRAEVVTAGGVGFAEESLDVGEGELSHAARRTRRGVRERKRVRGVMAARIFDPLGRQFTP